MARPPKRKHGTGRVTPKGTQSGNPRVAARSASSESDEAPSFGSSRYTPPVAQAAKESPRWVPILMFGLLAVGVLVIIVNYMFGDSASNWFLLLGLGFILGGIITATQYH